MATNCVKFLARSNCPQIGFKQDRYGFTIEVIGGRRCFNSLLTNSGVYFTKYCRDMALYLDLGGWVKNSRRGTIVGKIQGTKPKVEEMVAWLSRTGSPGCKIERCELRDFEYLARQDFRGFSIRF